MEFKYAPMFQLGEDSTEYYLLTKDYVSTGEFEGKPILKIAPEGLTAMANAAFRDVSFMLRPAHNEQVASILSDPEASDNDKYVALTFLRNAEVACKGVLPFCQDTGTAIIHGEKGQQVWTGYSDEEALSLGVFKTYTENNLRYSQNAPLSMYEEVNTKCNLPAQIDIESTEGMEYRAGERFGLIRFGSRLDVYLPEGVEPQVCLGQTMVAGETVIANLNSNAPQMKGIIR